MKCEVCDKMTGRSGRVEKCDLPVKLNKAITEYGQSQKSIDELRDQKNDVVWRLFYAKLAQAKLDLILGSIRQMEASVDRCWGPR